MSIKLKASHSDITNMSEMEFCFAIAFQELSKDPFVTNCQHDCPLVYLSMHFQGKNSPCFISFTLHLIAPLVILYTVW